MERQPESPVPTVEDYVTFAYETQARFLYYKAISEFTGKFSPDLDEGMIAQMEAAVTQLGERFMGLHMVAHLKTEHGAIETQLRGIGMDTSSGIILLVQQSPSHDPEKISLSDVAQLQQRP